MEYNFERFEEKPRVPNGEEPYVSIFSYGKIYLNRRAIELLGAPDAVALFFDPKQKVIGVQGVPPSRSYAFRLNKKDKRSLGSTIAATSFFNHHKMRPSETIAFPNLTLTTEGIMILDLNDVVTTSKKRK